MNNSISIIIIVKNDRDIKRTLEEINKIKKPQVDEIVVIDASPKDALKDIKLLFPKVNWQYYKSKKNKHTIPEQRNMGIRLSKGDIIVFIDANCIPSKNWLYNLLQPIIKENESIVCGKTSSLTGSTYRADYPVGDKNPKYIEECATINLAIHKNVFREIGYFDEAFNYGSDLDFTWRSVDYGYKIRYVQDAVIQHDWGNYNTEIKRAYRYGQGRAKAYKKHLNRINQMISKDNFYIFYIIYIIFLPLTFFFPYYPLFIIIPIVKNYNKKPFKTVGDHLSFAMGFLLEILTF